MVDAGEAQRRESDWLRESALTVQVTQRSQLKLFCVSICVIGAILCAWSHAFFIASGQLIAAIFVWRCDFGRGVAQQEMDAFLQVLRRTEGATGERAPLIQATVHPNVISAPMVVLEKKWTGSNLAISFRDEFSPIQWREVSTRLRHQRRSAPQVKSHR